MTSVAVSQVEPGQRCMEFAQSSTLFSNDPHVFLSVTTPMSIPQRGICTSLVRLRTGANNHLFLSSGRSKCKSLEAVRNEFMCS